MCIGKTYWKDVLVAGRALSPNQVITTAATCGHSVMIYLALQLGANHIQEAVNTASYGGHAHIVLMCHASLRPWLCSYVDLDEAMEWAAEGGHEDVVRLYKEIGGLHIYNIS